MRNLLFLMCGVSLSVLAGCNSGSSPQQDSTPSLQTYKTNINSNVVLYGIANDFIVPQFPALSDSVSNYAKITFMMQGLNSDESVSLRFAIDGNYNKKFSDVESMTFTDENAIQDLFISAGTLAIGAHTLNIIDITNQKILSTMSFSVVNDSSQLFYLPNGKYVINQISYINSVNGYCTESQTLTSEVTILNGLYCPSSNPDDCYHVSPNNGAYFITSQWVNAYGLQLNTWNGTSLTRLSPSYGCYANPNQSLTRTTISKAQ